MTHNLPGWGYYLCTVDAFLGRCGLEFTFI